MAQSGPIHLHTCLVLSFLFPEILFSYLGFTVFSPFTILQTAGTLNSVTKKGGNCMKTAIAMISILALVFMVTSSGMAMGKKSETSPSGTTSGSSETGKSPGSTSGGTSGTTPGGTSGTTGSGGTSGGMSGSTGTGGSSGGTGMSGGPSGSGTSGGTSSGSTPGSSGSSSGTGK